MGYYWLRHCMAETWKNEWNTPRPLIKNLRGAFLSGISGYICWNPFAHFITCYHTSKIISSTLITGYIKPSKHFFLHLVNVWWFEFQPCTPLNSHLESYVALGKNKHDDGVNVNLTKCLKEFQHLRHFYSPKHPFFPIKQMIYLYKGMSINSVKIRKSEKLGALSGLW